AVGDRYVLEEMLKSGNNLGGEQSGHIIFLDDSPAGDGLLTAVKVACLVALRGSLGALVEGLKDYPQKIVNVKVKTKRPWGTMAGSYCAIPGRNRWRALWWKQNITRM